MKRKYLAVPYLVWVIGFIIIPLLFIFGKALTTQDGSFTLQNILAIADPVHRKALFLSLGLAGLCTMICILLAYPLALIVRFSRWNGSGILMFILILPMWMNFILRIYALQQLISYNGIINFLLTKLGFEPLMIMNTPAAIVLGMVYDFLPYMVLPIMNSIMSIDGDLINAAKDLGAGKLHVFRKIILPLSFSGVGSGITMVFVPSMTSFVIADRLGGGKVMLLGNIIEQEFNVNMNQNLGSGLSVALMIFILITSIIFGTKDSSNEKGKLLW